MHVRNCVKLYNEAYNQLKISRKNYTEKIDQPHQRHKIVLSSNNQKLSNEHVNIIYFSFTSVKRNASKHLDPCLPKEELKNLYIIIKGKISKKAQNNNGHKQKANILLGVCWAKASNHIASKDILV